MNNPDNNFENYLFEQNSMEFPQEIRSILSKIFKDILNGGSEEIAPHDIGDQFYGHINLIPSDKQGRCCPLLVAICYDGDNFESRLLECLNHAAISCPDQNKLIYFFTTQWNTSTARKFSGFIEALRRNGVIVNMIHMTKKGLVLMPI